MVSEMSGLAHMGAGNVFSKQDYFRLLQQIGYEKTESSFLVYFQKLINDGMVQRVGRNAYCIAEEELMLYQHDYSELARRVAECISTNHPFMDCVVFETVQLNEFINHQIGRNTIFVFVEYDVMEFAFDTLRNEFPGRVLLNPATKEFHQYREEDTIVVTRLISEAPKDASSPWHETIEKLLVDIMADNLIKETFSESEYAEIYEGAFKRYVIDESKMFRYAKRRNAVTKIKTYMQDRTSVKLKLEDK